MLRIEEPSHWLLVAHQDHARLAGEFAEVWGNRDFDPPTPRDDVITAVWRHDDAWADRDAQPRVTRDGRPAAFSTELVGRYTAFEEIDLADYLRVRGQATEAVAADNPYAAILVSMHTLNLLTEQADLTSLSPSNLELHRKFVELQRVRQQQLIRAVSKAAGRESAPSIGQRDLAFRFLQACDSLSLAACVRYPRPMELRHRHPTRDGSSTTLQCVPQGADVYQVHPYPFAIDELTFRLPFRRVAKQNCTSDATLRSAYAQAPTEWLPIKIVRARANAAVTAAAPQVAFEPQTQTPEG